MAADSMSKLLTIQEAADALGVSVRYLEETKSIPRVQLPGKGTRRLIRFKVADLERIIDANTINPLPKPAKLSRVA